MTGKVLTGKGLTPDKDVIVWSVFDFQAHV